MSFINILARKFILKLASNPQADELLKKRLNKSQLEDPVFAKMLEHGVIPIIAPREKVIYDYDEDKENTIHNESAFLGEGQYSQVYEVSYKGKLAVAKITETFGDFSNMLRLDLLKPKLGEDAKHLPIIYDTFSAQVPDFDGGFIKKYIIIIEKLEPINSHLKATLFNFDNAKTNFNIMKSNIDLTDVSHKLIEQVKQNPLLIKLKETISIDQYNKLLESIEGIFRKAILSSNSLSNFGNKIDNLIMQLRDSKLVDSFKLNINQMTQFDYIMQSLYTHMKSIVKFNNFFPENTVSEESSSAKHFKELPESKSFMNFLLRLNKEFRISWGDLHSSNIMVRPSTGDLIVSDSGFFTGL